MLLLGHRSTPLAKTTGPTGDRTRVAAVRAKALNHYTNGAPNEAVSLFCVPRANKLHFENEIRYVVFLKYSKLISKK